MKNTIRLYFHPNKRGFTNTVYSSSLSGGTFAPFAEFLDTYNALEFAYTEACKYNTTTCVLSEEEDLVYVVEPDISEEHIYSMYRSLGEGLENECRYYNLDRVEWVLFPHAD